ncbi:pyruvate/ketoisovalerate oxidoreductase [Thermincola ferriacetica]|uniref:Pyruvate/ketoisovalerate oxidoreductase n=1 Tax=Thermincola ferriacetica TaxID=281456 RepID=A0A0L6VYC0_9FIRM|nr:indolepyruvate oxidoreductase subunit beta [Thermincola ferriacetica]KNZ68327.1 pyruvate/ketoisovalerate oxidoreductase [Thermincola ferriacetica]
MSQDIVIAGVGGQGTVLASRIIAEAAILANQPVFTSETIGMAQREGCVTSNVRIGEPLYGAVIPDGKADVLIGFELAETVRLLPKLKPGGTVIANATKIVPVSVATGKSVYNEAQLSEYLNEWPGSCYIFDASRLAEEAGSFKAVNIVMLGALSTLPDLLFTSEQLLEAILAMVPPKTTEINEKAFLAGRQALGGS